MDFLIIRLNYVKLQSYPPYTLTTYNKMLAVYQVFKYNYYIRINVTNVTNANVNNVKVCYVMITWCPIKLFRTFNQSYLLFLLLPHINIKYGHIYITVILLKKKSLEIFLGGDRGPMGGDSRVIRDIF